jgi:hypothetical protein
MRLTIVFVVYMSEMKMERRRRRRRRTAKKTWRA